MEMISTIFSTIGMGILYAIYYIIEMALFSLGFVIGIIILLIFSGGIGVIGGFTSNSHEEADPYKDDTGTAEWLKPNTEAWRMSHPLGHNAHDFEDPWGEKYRDGL